MKLTDQFETVSDNCSCELVLDGQADPCCENCVNTIELVYFDEHDTDDNDIDSDLDFYLNFEKETDDEHVQMFYDRYSL